MQEISLTFALVRGVRGQGVPKEAILAAVTVEASSVVDALEALAGPAVTVAHGIGLHVAIAPARLARLGSCWVSKVAIGTVLTVGPFWERRDEQKLMLVPGRQRLSCCLAPQKWGCSAPSGLAQQLLCCDLPTFILCNSNSSHPLCIRTSLSLFLHFFSNDYL